MDLKEIQDLFGLPEGCPIPGASYRRKLSSGRWEFGTITGLEVLPRDRWSAIFFSVRFGSEHITSEVNRMEKFELHSLPNLASADESAAAMSESIDTSIDELDMLLSAGV